MTPDPELGLILGRHAEQMTDDRDRSGKASVLMRSKPPAPSAAASSRTVTSRIHGSSAAIALGLNAPVTSRRSRVWSGGSMLSRSAAGSPARGSSGG